METIDIAYQKALAPSPRLIADMARLEGDLIILGVAGKMGPDLARLARRALDAAGQTDRKVIGVSRFSDPETKAALEREGVTTIAADLLDDAALAALPAAPNVIYMAGHKFGTSGNESFTWAMNTYLPGRVADRYKDSRIVVFSSGNIYPFLAAASGGACEKVSPEPIGEYAQSCLGRERIFEYHALKNKTPMVMYRLNYANDVSYGVLVEIARSVREERPVNLAMGNVNVIWQGDANEYALRSLLHTTCPPRLLNITGPETASVRWLANEFGQLFGKTPLFEGEEQPTALLNNAAESFRLFGYPNVSLKEMMALIAEWLKADKPLLNKPTHFQERKGKF
ncbi:epimerase [Parapedobacter defluvii]|uniref:epimerase n=1 Tax=Parapedobacter defluvii TaxID=2045106 RepID=UPI000FB66159|nr:MAG: epimerase [Parapedobacter sp.]